MRFQNFKKNSQPSSRKIVLQKKRLVIQSIINIFGLVFCKIYFLIYKLSMGLFDVGITWQVPDNLSKQQERCLTTKLLIAWFTSTRGVYQFRTVKPVHFFRAKESLLIHLIHDLCMPVSDSNHSGYIITTLCRLFEWQREDKQESKSLIIRG